MSKLTVITKAQFDKMLAWLDSDREAAGQKYEEIRRSLINIFNWGGCYEAEDLADEVVNIVLLKSVNFFDSYTGDPALYFYGIAKNLIKQCRRRENVRVSQTEKTIEKAEHATQSPVHPSPLAEVKEAERRDECLTRCMNELEPDDAQLVIAYYRGTGQQRIDNRRRLAEELGLAPATLRVKLHRIREPLEKCVKRCLETSP